MQNLIKIWVVNLFFSVSNFYFIQMTDKQIDFNVTKIIHHDNKFTVNVMTERERKNVATFVDDELEKLEYALMKIVNFNEWQNHKRQPWNQVAQRKWTEIKKKRSFKSCLFKFLIIFRDWCEIWIMNLQT